MEVFERLREVREKLGYTQEAFGALGGVKKIAQYNYERGTRTPDVQYLTALGSAGIDVAYILVGKGTLGVQITPTELFLVDEFRRSKPDVQRAARQLLAAPPKTREVIKTVLDAAGIPEPTMPT
jgi:transcriptional regulator with XRE-family HTH domain